MSKELQLINPGSVKDIIAYAPEHKEMILKLEENLPEIQRATSLFGKTQSQFMDNMLTVSHTTPVRNLRQILAEVEKLKNALQEAYFKDAKRSVEIKMKLRDLENEKDELKKELIEIEINELRTQADTSNKYVSGAIRSITNYMEQYNSILASMGVTDFNEIDFEKEEEKYHIQKAFEQGLTAARSHDGRIDEGNMIYFTQIGINGAAAQAEVRGYLIYEQEMLKQGHVPTHGMFLTFLNQMSEKYAGSAQEYAKAKGMTGTITEYAALKEGDTRLLLK